MAFIKIEKDPERAKSLVMLAELRYKRLKTFDLHKESSLIAEGYYEVCKEIITALLFLDGKKTLIHKELIEYIEQNYAKEFPSHEIALLDDLRKRRNNIVYYGIFVNPEYITRNKSKIDSLITQLKREVEKKLK